MPQPEDAQAMTRGIATILATVFAMALVDAVVKAASSNMTLWQLWVLRSAITVPVLLLLARRMPVPAGLAWVLARSLALTLMYVCLYAVLPVLDLSEVAATLYSAPLFIVILSALALRERITGRQWVAILAGFAGVLCIVRPAAAGFTPLALVPVGAALLYAVAAVMTRIRCAQIPAPALALWLNLTLLAAGAVASLLAAVADLGKAAIRDPFLFGPWQPMGFGDWQVVVLLALLMLGIAIGLARAYQSPRPQVIATFDYAYLIFAAFWGYVFFDEVPRPSTWVGMALIAAAGLMILVEGGGVARGKAAVQRPDP
jgi:drug/metabolite transporter (DMT)-like permease